MKVYLVFGFVLSAIFAIALSASCHHNDPSTCTDMTCTGNNTAVGCEHETCTCVVSYSCLDKSDCDGADVQKYLDCDPHRSPHCIDRKCSCYEDGHHGQKT